MGSQSESLTPTPSTSSISQVSTSLPTLSPSLTFTNIPDQVFTCTGLVVTWNSSQIFSDPNSDANDTAEDIYPFSIMTIDITGSYMLTEPGSDVESLTLRLSLDSLYSSKHQNNVTFEPVIVPPGIYYFVAGLTTNTKSNTSAILHPVASYTFSSPSFMVVNGSTTGCVIHPVQPTPSSTSSLQTPGNLSSTGNHLNGGAIAGITIGSIVAALLVFLLAALLRLRFARRNIRSYPNGRSFIGKGMPGVLKPGTRREKRDTADFIGLQSFDSLPVPPDAANLKEQHV